MTKEEILALEPGAELDTLVEEKLFDHRCELRWCNWLPEGWFEVQSYGGGKEVVVGGLLDENKLLPCYKEGEKWIVAPFYSIDISAAWLVVEKRIKASRYFGLQRVVKDGEWLWEASFGEPVFGLEVPKAICRAALLSKLEVKDG